jgi:hypothetical protein
MLLSLEQRAQTFSIATEQLGINEFLAPTNVGSGVSVMDLDQNGWDDIFFGNSIDGDIVCYFNEEMNFSRTVIFQAGGDYKSTLAADYDNDGDQDILVTRDSGELLLLQNNGEEVFTDVAEQMGFVQASLARSYGATWFDADNDGWLDLYVSNYNSTLNSADAEIQDWFYHSDGDGSFTLATNQFGFIQGLDATFQSSAFPFNQDEFLDVYVINDFFFQNKLFLSQENGNYNAASSSDPPGMLLNAMSNTVGDFDNDGDFDIYVTNTPNDGNVLFENDEGTFVNVASEFNLVVNRFCVGAIWLDADNDLNKDLYVGDAYTFDTFSPPLTFTRDHLFRQSNGEFESVDYIPLDEGAFDTYAVAKGDLNKDGFVDLVLSTSLNQGIQVLINNGDSGFDAVKLNLEGTVSNRDGIGSLVDYFIDGIRYREVVQCGSEYLNQNSKTLLLPCAEFPQIDSLFLKWSSGIVDKIYAIPAGNEITVVEGQSQLTIIQNAAYICPGQSVQLSINVPEGSSITWNQSQVGEVVSITQAGEYFATVITPDGFTLFTDSVFLDWVASPEVTASITSPSCWGFANGSIELVCASCQSFLWENVIPNSTLQNIGAGSYSCSVTDVFGCVSDYQYLVEEPEPLSFFYSWIDASCFGSADGDVKFDIVFGGIEPFDLDFNGADFYSNLSGQELLQTTFDGLLAGEYYITLSDANGCSYSDQFAIQEPDPIIVDYTINQNMVELNIQGGVGLYTVDWGVSGVEGTTAQLENGLYTVIITDILGCEATVQFQINYTDIQETEDARLKWWVKENHLTFDQLLSRVEVFDVQGRLLASLSNVSDINTAAWNNQWILVKATDKSGMPIFIRIVVH